MKANLRSYTKSSSFFMALLFTVLCGAVALSLGYFINYFAKGHFVHSTQSVIDSEIKFIDTLGDIPTEKSNPGRLYIRLDSQGQLPENYPQPSKFLTEGLLVFPVNENKQLYAARIHTMQDGRKLLVGADISEMADNFDFMQGIGIASIAFVMIVVFVSYLISIFVVNGTNKIADTAYEIIRTGDLSRRVEVNSHWDDLSNVANVLNTLFDRIQELMNGVRQVSDNIAHDLRTPLTRMRSNIEALQNRYPQNHEYQKLLNEADQMLETFAALLRISRIETEQQRSQFTHLFLDKILQDVLDFYEPLIEHKKIGLTVELSEVALHGDRNLLFQAFANLLDNAVKYSPERGWVNVSLQLRDDHPVVHIENSANKIAEGDLDKIFHRFYRTDKSRNPPGSGLGLSLVAAVIALHGGTVKAKNLEQGLGIITIF